MQINLPCLVPFVAIVSEVYLYDLDLRPDKDIYLMNIICVFSNNFSGS